MNRQDLETSIARILGDLLIEGIVDSGNGNSIADTELVFAETGLLRGMDIHFKQTTSPTISDLARTIATYSQGSLGFIPSLAFAPTVGDTYNIYKSLRHADYKAAIEDAHRRASELYLVETSATLALVATQWEYAVPSGFKYIHSIRLVPSVGTDYETLDSLGFNIYQQLDRGSWTVRTLPNGSRVIAFDPRYLSLDNYNNYAAIVEGQRRPGSLSSPTFSIEPAIDGYIFASARAMLAPRLIRDANRLPELISINNGVDRLEKRIFRTRRAGSVEVG